MEMNHLNNQTTVQLQSQIKLNKTIAFALVIVLSLLTAVCIYGLIAKDDTSTFIALLAFACTSWTFLVIPFSTMKNAQTELAYEAACG